MSNIVFPETIEVVLGAVGGTCSVLSFVGSVPLSVARVLCATDCLLVAVKAPLNCLCGSERFRTKSVETSTMAALRKALHAHGVNVGRDVYRKSQLEALVDTHECVDMFSHLVHLLRIASVNVRDGMNASLTHVVLEEPTAPEHVKDVTDTNVYSVPPVHPKGSFSQTVCWDTDIHGTADGGFPARLVAAVPLTEARDLCGADSALLP